MNASQIKSLEIGSVMKIADTAKELGVSSENLRYYMEEATKRGTLNKSRLAGDTVYTVMKK